MPRFSGKLIRPVGMILIFLFAAFSIFASIFVRDIDRSTYFGSFIEYTNSFENRYYDFRMRGHLNSQFVSSDILLLKIDDYSLQKLGTWPLPRTVYGDMLKKLKHFGAKVVALDIMFPEKSPIKAHDMALTQAIKDFQTDGRRVFIAYHLAGSFDETLEEAPLEMLNDAIQTQNAAGAELSPQKIDRFTFPIEDFVVAEVGLGSINSREDSDGVFRQYHLLSNIDSIYYGSLALNAFEAFKEEKHTIKIFSNSTAELNLKGKPLEISREGETKIRYIGSSENFPELSLFDLLNSDDENEGLRNLLSDKIVFVGSTATGAHDLRPAPIDSKMPGVYSHINMAHMLLNQYFFKPSNDSVMISLAILVVGMLILIGSSFLENAFVELLTLVGIVILSYQIDKHFLLPNGYEIKLFYCYFCFIASYSWSTFWEFWESNQEKRKIKGTFARYVAPTVVEEMLKDPEKLKIGGQKMDITCLFSDVRDFTSISEGLSATDLAHSLNFYMTKMTDIVFETKGTLDKYIGDAIVAIWGAPLPIGNHAQKAVEAAIAMMELMPEINREFRRLGRPEFKVGIGLNTGECSVGNMGSNRIFSYTALGDNMNLGARLEGLCKYYGCQILISEFTHRHLSGIKTRPIDKVIVKGKTEPVMVLEVLHRNHPLSTSPEAFDLYIKAHDLFSKRDFQKAQNEFIKLQSLLENEDIPTSRFLALCKKYLSRPDLVGEDFDVTKMTEK